MQFAFPAVAGTRRHRPRPVHGHHGHLDHRRRAAEDPGATSASRPTDLSWVFNAYVIAFGGLLLLGGRLSDLFGAKRVFIAGWAVLAVGSLAAGLAGSPASRSPRARSRAPARRSSRRRR